MISFIGICIFRKLAGKTREKSEKPVPLDAWIFESIAETIADFDRWKPELWKDEAKQQKNWHRSDS